MATHAIARHFNNEIPADKISNSLKEVHDVVANKGDFVTFARECLDKEHPGITHNPTHSPTDRPTAVPTPPTIQRTNAPTSQFSDNQKVGIGIGGFFASVIVITCLAIAGCTVYEKIENCLEAKKVRPTDDVELDTVNVVSTPAPLTKQPSGSSLAADQKSAQR